MSLTIRVYPDFSPRLVEILPADIDAPTQGVSVQDIYDAVRDWEDEPAHMAYPYMISGAGKEQLGSGVTVGITATLLNAQVLFTGRTTPLEENGTCDVSNIKGTTLYATAGSGLGFVANEIYPGCTVVNETTNSRAAVIEVISETELRCFKLTGGSNEQWTSGDVYQVLPNVQCNIAGGNLVAVDDAGDEMSSVFPTPNVQVVRTSSSSATLQELEAIQYASYGGGVTVDSTSPYNGTEFPVGTPQQPVNNLTDALVISSTRGFTTFFIMGSMTIDSGGDYTGMVFIGESMTKSTLTVDANANVINAEFYDAHVTGTLDGNAKLKGCRIDDLDYVYGVIEQCLLDPGVITLGGSSTAHFLDCWSGVPGLSTPEIDCGGSGQGLGLRNYNGGIRLSNKKGAEDVSIDLNSGQVILDSDVTNGTIVIRGIGKLTDNSVGATVDATHLLSPENIADAVHDEIVEGTVTLRQAQRAFLATLVGLSSGGDSSNIKFRDTEDTTDRIDETVDANGNRLTVTLDLD